ncbi:MAG: thioredoxin fold domain-containing protein [Sulfuricaulis sp.]|uniref:thioredoxin family protein n=1 Tax=Sulfuricaulis sp. TaxID=2003553 RepID=UPI003C5AB595
MKRVHATSMTALVLGGFLGLMGMTVSVAEKAEFRGAGQFVIPGWFKHSFLDLPEDVVEASREGKRLLLYFGQDGCPYCAALFNTNFSQSHIVDYTRRHFDAIEFNIWGNREVTDFAGRKLSEKEFAANLQVWFTPTILLIGEKGETVLRINGYYPPHQFLAALQYVAEKQEDQLTFRAYLAKLAPPPAKGALHPEPFFAKPPHDLSKMTSGNPLAVFFEQKDCAGCDWMHSEMLADPDTLEQIRRFHVIQLDRWSDTPVVTPEGRRTTARQWADELNIVYLPNVVMFDAGKEVIRIEAFMKGFHVQSVLDYVASGAYKRQPSLQRFIRERADAMRERGVVVDIWK